MLIGYNEKNLYRALVKFYVINGYKVEVFNGYVVVFIEGFAFYPARIAEYWNNDIGLYFIQVMTRRDVKTCLKYDQEMTLLFGEHYLRPYISKRAFKGDPIGRKFLKPLNLTHRFAIIKDHFFSNNSSFEFKSKIQKELFQILLNSLKMKK